MVLKNLIGYFLASPKVTFDEEKFTALYILGECSAWTVTHTRGFRGGSSTEEYVSPLYSCRVEQYDNTDKDDYMELSQQFYAQDSGVVVMSFNVRDSYTDDVRGAYPETATDAKNISKQVRINDEAIWDEDLLGKNGWYEGWVVEEYVWGGQIPGI